MTKVVEHEVRWTRGRKAPVLKLDDIDVDVLTVRVTGDAEGTVKFDREIVRRIAREHHAPHHYTLKIDPRLLRLFWDGEMEFKP